MASSDNEVRMMMSVYPGAMTGFAAMNAGLSSILNVFNGMTRAFDQQFGLVDAALTTTSVVVTQLGVDAMNAFGQFEQGMKIVQMVSGQTASDMDLLKQKANEFSVEYRTDIDQITEGLQTLGRAGLNTASEQAEVLESGLTTAKLEGRELNGVLQELIQNTALLGGNLKSSEFGEDSQYVNDLLVATSMTAPITTHDISETLKYSGGIAAAAGAKIRTDTGEMNEQGKAILEDYMGTIAAFAQKGVTGSIAGTALRAFLNKPATQDSSVTDALASIHLKPEYLWEEGEEVMKPISQQIAIIQNQMDKLDVSTMDRLQIWSKIVGGKMGQQMMKLDSQSIKDITKDIQAADSAENLAANSMKTYEANIKAAKESAAGLQRNVGEKLVLLANPWLEMMNKVLEFLNNDVTGSVLAGSVIAFVGFLFTQIRKIASTIRGEISSLLSLTKDARAYIHQSMTGRAQLDKEQVGSFISMNQVSSKQKQQNVQAVAEQKAAEDFKSFNQAYNKQLGAQSKLSFAALTDAGVTGDRMGVLASLQTIKKKDAFGLRLQDYVAAGMMTKSLPEGMEENLIKLRKSGLTGRSLADVGIGEIGSAELEAFIAHIQSVSENLKLLGLTAEQVAAEMNGAGTSGKFRYGSWHDSDKRQRTLNALESYKAHKESSATIQKQKSTEKEEAKTNAATAAAEAHATALGEEVKAEETVVAVTKEKQAEIVETVQSGATTVEREFNAMMAAISASFSKYGPNARFPAQNYNVMPGYVSPSNIPLISSTGEDVFANVGKRSAHIVKEYLRSGLGIYGIQDDAGMLNTIAKARFPQWDSFSEAVKKSHLANLAIYPDIGRENQIGPMLYGKPAPAGAVYGPLPPGQIYGGAVGVGSLPGLEDYFRRQGIRVPPDPTINTSVGQKLMDQHQENVKTQNSLSKAQIGAEGYRQALDEVAAAEERAMTALQKHAERTATLNDEQKHRQELVQQARDEYAAADRASTEALNKHQEQVRKNKQMQSVRPQNESEMVHDSTKSHSFVGHASATHPYDRSGIKEEYRMLRRIAQEEMKQREKGLRTNAQINADQERMRIRQQRQLEQSQSLSDRIKARLAGDPKAYNPATGLMGKLSERHDASYLPKQGQYNPYNYQPAPIFGQMFGGQPSEVMAEEGKKSSEKFGAAFRQNFSNRLNRDRMGSFLSFGSEMAGGQLRSATKGLSGFANKLLNATDMVGGPFMVAMMAIPALINIWKGIFEDFCNDLKEAGDNVKEAYSNLNSAEDSLRQTYREGNPDSTEEEIDEMVLDSYGKLYDDLATNQKEYLKKASQAAAKPPEYEYDEEKDDGSVKVKEEELDSQEEYNKALQENTAALYAATSQLNLALGEYTTKMTDSWWGLDGWTGQITDALQIKGEDSTFTAKGDFLLTTSQQDENYSGYTEMAGLMLEDMKDANGNWIKGMRTMMGEDVEFYSAILGENTPGYNFLKGSAKFASQDLTSAQNARLQASMKNDSKTWKQLAKELAKYESKNKKTYDPYGKSTDKGVKSIQDLTKKLLSTLGKGFDATKVLQAAYLQIAQDMFAVAQTVFVPLVQQNAISAAQTVAGVGQVFGATDYTGGNTYNTAAIAASIAALLGTIALAQSGDAARAQAMISPDINNDGNITQQERDIHDLALNTDSGDQFMREAIKQSETNPLIEQLGERVRTVPNLAPLGEAIYRSAPLFANRNAADYLAKVYGVTTYMSTRGMDSETATEEINKYVDQKIAEGVSPSDIIKTLGKNWTSKGFTKQLEDTYLNSLNDDEGTGSGGGGGGSGSGKDKDKDTGTKKERVDLVLCNKKEIPKLNVNLFKKAPSFTILNKNFKLRDIKVNTQDKPKAVLASIKNAIIDVQKRTDPKIIQDEQAEYDPVAATDGNQTPSGSTGTTTDE